MFWVRHTLFNFAAAAISLAPLAAFAYTNPTPQRSYVSIHGVDGNTCGSSAPCRTWQYAMDIETQPGGEVLTLDSGGFGLLNITKQVTIVVPPGVYGGMSSPVGSDGVLINVPGANVILRRLTINSQAGGLNGVQVLAAISVTLDGCTIANFTVENSYSNAGLIASGIATTLRIINSTFRNNYYGIAIEDGPSATIVNTQLVGSVIALNFSSSQTGSTTTAAVSESSAVGNGYGFYAIAWVPGSVATMNVDRSRALDNHSVGVGSYSEGGSANVSVSNTQIMGSDRGIYVLNPGGTVTASGNSISGQPRKRIVDIIN